MKIQYFYFHPENNKVDNEYIINHKANSDGVNGINLINSISSLLYNNSELNLEENYEAFLVFEIYLNIFYR